MGKNKDVLIIEDWSIGERVIDGTTVYFLLAYGTIQTGGWFKKGDAERALYCLERDGTTDQAPAEDVELDEIGMDFQEALALGVRRPK